MSTTNTTTAVVEYTTVKMPEFKSKELTAATQKIATIISKAFSAAYSAQETRDRQLADVFYKVESQQLYAMDGFKSLREYADAIGIKKSYAHLLASAGAVYNNAKAPEALKALSPSKVAELAPALKDDTVRDKIFTDAEAGKLDTATQKEIRAYAAEVRGTAPKAKVEKRYHLYMFPVSDLRDYIKTEDAFNFLLGDIEAVIGEFEPDATEVIKLPASDDFKRWLVCRPDGTLSMYGAMDMAKVNAKLDKDAKAVKKSVAQYDILLTRIQTKLEYDIPLTDDEYDTAVEAGLLNEND